MIAESTVVALVAPILGFLSVCIIGTLQYLNLRVSRENREHLQRNTEQMAVVTPAVVAIDDAVNGKPPGARSIGQEVTGLVREAARVAAGAGTQVTDSDVPALEEILEAIKGTNGVTTEPRAVQLHRQIMEEIRKREPHK